MTSMSDRDKKILLALVPVALLLVFWFLVLSPKRAEVADLNAQVSTAQTARDDAVTKAGSLEGARSNYAKDYETVVRLGKAVPSTIDMPSLLVQLDSAAKGTKIKFASVKAGERTPGATTSTTPSTTSSGSGSTSAPPVAAGGAQAQSGAGQSAEKANNAAAATNQSSANSNQSSQAAGTSTTPSSGTSTTPSSGSTSSTPAAGAADATSGTAGLDSVPLDFTFTGSYFDLADFFHQMKRFVRMARGDVQVKGRLLTIDKVKFDSTTFPKIKADITATVYLSPKSEGTTAGGTPSGPQATGGTATPTPAASNGSNTPTPGTTSGGSAQ